MRPVAGKYCRVEKCGLGVTPRLRASQLCLDHFLEQTFARVQQALEHCHQGQPLDPGMLEWLVGDAPGAIEALVAESSHAAPHQKNRLLELLLSLSNLQEYIRHHSVRLTQHRRAG